MKANNFEDGSICSDDDCDDKAINEDDIVDSFLLMNVEKMHAKTNETDSPKIVTQQTTFSSFEEWRRKSVRCFALGLPIPHPI